MNAIEWLADKAVYQQTEIVTISDEEADKPEDVGTYECRTKYFCGKVPYHMVKSISKCGLKSNDEFRQLVLVNLKNNTVEFWQTETCKIA